VNIGPGLIIGNKYLVKHLVGEGGMGLVVAAEHIDLRHPVAIKVLRPGAGALVEERFLREARAVVRVRSDHVARVFDVGTLESGEPYMVMELLDGHDLSELLDERAQLPIEQAVSYVIQTCTALSEVHAVGVIHRDVKPANLFVTKRTDGSARVKLLDFGISKEAVSATQTPESLTQSGTMLGSPIYMSPEQLTSSRDVDFRTDVWSLGAVLFELLAGEAPFPGLTVAELYSAILRDEPHSLLELRPGVPSGLVGVIDKCLEKDPDRRYQSVDELADALLTFATVTDEPAGNLVPRRSSHQPDDASLDPAATLDMPDSSAGLPAKPPRSSGRPPELVTTTAGAASAARPPAGRSARVSLLLLIGLLVVGGFMLLRPTATPARLHSLVVPTLPQPPPSSSSMTAMSRDDLENAQKAMHKLDDTLPQALRKRLKNELTAARQAFNNKNYRRARSGVDKVTNQLRKHGLYEGYQLSKLGCTAAKLRADLGEVRFLKWIRAIRNIADFPNSRAFLVRDKKLSDAATLVMRLCGPLHMSCNLARQAEARYRIGTAFAKLTAQAALRPRALPLARGALMYAEITFRSASSVAKASGRCIAQIRAGMKKSQAAQKRLPPEQEPPQ